MLRKKTQISKQKLSVEVKKGRGEGGTKYTSLKQKNKKEKYGEIKFFKRKT